MSCSTSRLRPLALLLALMALIAGCGQSPSLSRRATAPTSTPTPLPPTATPTPTPSPTPTATPTPDLSRLTPTVQPTPLPDNVSPFTGLEVADPAVLNRMPAAVKISNSPIARPQSGLSRADIVVEHLAEGGITRFTAIFHSEDAERIGSVRSARLIDLELPVLFDAFLVYSGAHGEVTRLIESSDFADRTLCDDRGDAGFYRLDIPGRAYEHTLFTDSQLLQQVAAAQGWTQRPRHRGWTWSAEPPAGAAPARTVEIPYSADYADVRYQYDPEIGAYRRWITGQVHVDELTGEQIAVANVVVLYVNHVETPIVENLLGSRSVQIQLWGQGRAQLFRNGVVLEGLWVRPNREDPLLFVDAAGQPLPLKPGKVWIQLVPLDMVVTYSE
ncbi:MAG: DUF3048 domain-containing protein [Caldilineales bacterium]|nr:DUF3048 domain-containing protein [Caldilineales bacterium]MDW8318000.1 DUF3048 domain-containing protein [Anaerolineae bacterium]